MLQKSLRILRSSISDSPVSSTWDKSVALQESEDAHSRPSRFQIGLWSLLLVLSCLLFVAKYSEFQIGSYRDDAAYIILAQSIVHSDTYGLINGPVGTGHTQFPFGFPLVLVPIVLLAPDKLDAFRVVSLLATLINCALLFWGWHSISPKRSYWWALAVVGLYALSPQVVDQSRMVMSEPVFTTFCLIALLLTEQAARHREGRAWFFWMGIALVFVLFIRTIGFTLVLAVFPYLIWKRGVGFSKSLLLVILVLALAIGAILFLTPISGSDLLPFGYVTQLQNEGADDGLGLFVGYPIDRFTQHLGVYLWQFLIPFGGGESADLFFSSLGLPFASTVLNMLLLSIVILGFVAWIRETGISSFMLFAIVYLGIVYFWTWDGRRFLYPIAPQLYFALVLGCDFLLTLLSARLPESNLLRRSIPMLLCGLVIFLMVIAFQKSTQLESSVAHMGDVYGRTTWLKANTQPTDVIMTDQPGIDYINSGHKTVRFRNSYTSQAAFEQHMAELGVKYVLVAPTPDWQAVYTPRFDSRVENALPLLDALVAQNHIKRVYASSEAWIQIFQVQP